MTFRLALFLAGGLAFLALVAGSYKLGHKAGVDSERSAQLEVIEQYKNDQKRLIAELEQAREEIRIEYRERVKVIRETPDPSGCADAVIPDGIMQQLAPR